MEADRSGRLDSGLDRERLLRVLGSASLSALMVSRAQRYRTFTLDDAFIKYSRAKGTPCAFRYAKHLAEGLGPSWNPRAEPAQGYTTALWMLLLAATQLLGLDGLWFAEASRAPFGVAALSVAALLCQRAARTARQEPLARMVGIVCVFALGAR